jgi:hypothetical protein
MEVVEPFIVAEPVKVKKPVSERKRKKDSWKEHPRIKN